MKQSSLTGRFSKASAVRRLVVVGLLLVAFVGLGAAQDAQDTENFTETDFGSDVLNHSFDLDMLTQSVISQVTVDDRADSGEITVSIYGGNGSMLVSETIDTSTTGRHNEFIFSENDYSRRLNAGETVTVEINGTTNFNIGDSKSYSGDSFSFSNQKLPYVDDSSYPSIEVSYNYNSPPNFTLNEPESWTLGSSVNVSANVSDDSQVSSVEADVWENGTQIVDGQALTNTEGDTWSVQDLFAVDESDVYYNFTLTATDDQGATSTYSDSQYIADEAPDFTLDEPGNQTYFDYSRPWSIELNTDGDNAPEEDVTCTVYDNGNVTETVALKEGDSENSTASGTVENDVGQHSLNVSCSDPAGNTASDSVDYTIKAFEYQKVNSFSETWETTNEQFDAEVKHGSMVQELEFNLVYNGSKVSSSTEQVSGINTFTETLDYGIPLVDSNSSYNWSIQTEATITGLNGGNTTETFNSSNETQEVKQSYTLQDSYFQPSNEVVETDEITHTAQIAVPGADNAQLEGETNWPETVESMDENNRQFTSTITTPRQDDSNFTDYNADSTVTISFNGDERELTTGDEQYSVYRARITSCNEGLSNEETLSFNSFYETDGQYPVNTDLNMDISVLNEDVSRQYSYISEDKEEHTFCIYPEWAEFDVQTRAEDLIQYEKSDDNGVLRSYFFPQRQTINNQTTDVDLYTLNESETERIDYEIEDSDGQDAPGVICRIDRKFPGLGKHQTVSMIKTGSQGSSETFLEVNEIYYKHVCYQNGEGETFDDQIIENPMYLQLGGTSSTSSLDYNNIDSECSYNESSISCDYGSPYESMDKIELTVEQRQISTNTEVCRRNGTTLTGTLTCSGLNTSQNAYTFSVNAHFDNDKYLVERGFIGDNNDQFGAPGLLITLMLFLAVTAVSTYRLLIGVFSGIVVLVASSFIGFYALGPTGRASLIAVGILVGWVISRGS